MRPGALHFGAPYELPPDEPRFNKLTEGAGDKTRGGATQPDIGISPNFRLFPLLFALFFHCFPLFLRRRLFSRPRKDLYCRRRAFPMADRLYFSKSPFGLHPCSATRNEELVGIATKSAKKKF